MAWRVIVRVSFFSDTGSRLRNDHMEPLMAAMGLRNTATGTWESPSIAEHVAAQQMTQLLQLFANPPGARGVDPRAALKHLWVYVDRVEDGDGQVGEE